MCVRNELDFIEFVLRGRRKMLWRDVVDPWSMTAES